MNLKAKKKKIEEIIDKFSRKISKIESKTLKLKKNIEKEELDNDYLIRRQAVDFNVPLITDLQVAKRLVETMQRTSLEDLKIKSWDEYE